MGCGAAEATALGFVCYVVINVCCQPTECWFWAFFFIKLLPPPPGPNNRKWGVLVFRYWVRRHQLRILQYRHRLVWGEQDSVHWSKWEGGCKRTYRNPTPPAEYSFVSPLLFLCYYPTELNIGLLFCFIIPPPPHHYFSIFTPHRFRVWIVPVIYHKWRIVRGFVKKK